MKQFSVFQHPIRGYEAVKNGWSWPAFFFTWIWAFVKRLWLVGVMVLLPGFFLSMPPEPQLWGMLIISIVLGAIGNRLRVRRLRNAGYEQVATVAAGKPDAALAVHLAAHGNQGPLPPEGFVR